MLEYEIEDGYVKVNPPNCSLSTQPTLERYVEQPAGRSIREPEADPEPEVRGGREGDSASDGDSAPPDLFDGTSLPRRFHLSLIDETGDDLEDLEGQTDTSGTGSSQSTTGDEDFAPGRALLQERWLPILCLTCDTISAIAKILMK